MSESLVVEMHFDFASPYSYMADCRVDEVLKGLPVRLVRVPVYLRGFELFARGVPYPPQKLAFIGADLMRHSQRFSVPFRLTPHFPVNGLHALRALVALEGSGLEDAFRRAAFRAAWFEQRDVADTKVIGELVGEVGGDAAAVGVAMRSDAVKEKLKTNTAASVERGGFGVPTFFVGGELIWGQDRLDFVRWEIERQLAK